MSGFCAVWYAILASVNFGLYAANGSALNLGAGLFMAAMFVLCSIDYTKDH